MKKTIITALSFGLALGVSSIASANDFQLSAGGTYIFDSADSEFAFTTFTARGAYYFTERFGFEAEGSLGMSGVSDYAGTGLDIDLKNQFGGYFIGRFPTGENGEFFGRLGWRAGNFESTLQNVSIDTSYNGFSLGGGYTHFISEGVGLRGEITTSGASLDGNIEPEGNLTSASVSVVFRLGGSK